MSAYEIPNLRFSTEAGATVARRRFVKINSNERGVQAVEGDAVIGVSMNETSVNEVLEIADGIVMVEAGGAVVSGTEVQSDANGKAITKAAGVRAGVAMTNASSGELVTIKIGQ